MKKWWIFALFCVIVQGCAHCIRNDQPDGFSIHWGSYPEEPSSLLVKRYGGFSNPDGWSNIGYQDPLKPKGPWTLRNRDNYFKIIAGRPKGCLGHIIGVQVWMGDKGSIQAQNNGGFYDFAVYTYWHWIAFGSPFFDSLERGIYPIRVDIDWTCNPYTDSGPAQVDTTVTLFGSIDFNPSRVH